MESRLQQIIRWLLGPESGKTPGHLGPRWIFLRAIGGIYFSAFYSLLLQAKGLIGPDGILPANVYLNAVDHYLRGLQKLWFVPSVFWFGSSDHALVLVCWIGLAASLLLFLNVWPRGMSIVCFICFLSFVSTLQDFSSYQSDGMLLEAGFLCLFFTPGGFWPGWGEKSSPSRACLFLLQWEWFRIYFESGMAKVLGGDPEWRHLTAMVHYYQDGPLPTWIGWYVQHLPFWFHWSTALATLVMELGIVLMLFMPRRFRIACFFIFTLWEAGVIMTANYAFLNYLVLALGFLLLDDRFLAHLIPCRWLPGFHAVVAMRDKENRRAISTDSGLPALLLASTASKPVDAAHSVAQQPPASSKKNEVAGNHVASEWRQTMRDIFGPVKMTIAAICFAWLFYASSTQIVSMLLPEFSVWRWPVEAIAPLRIADEYGLFAIMTRGRYEIEFQGSNDGGKTWIAYPFQNKPQDVDAAPRIYAPYQPRFDWNLWFASLGNWRQYPIVVSTEEALLDGSPEVISLFAKNPFPAGPPKEIRAVLWQYWFTDMATKRKTGAWWKRELIGLYAPVLLHEPDGKFGVLELPQPLPERHD